jgi:Uma2 family endonuclease
MSAYPTAILLKTTSALRCNNEEFYEFCQENKDYRIERTHTGEIVIQMPTGGDTSSLNFELSLVLGIWAHQDQTGKGFDSSGGFILPNKAVRSPDLSWVKKERLDALTAEERKKFIPLCPDFVVEIRSSSDTLKPLQKKMDEYIANGALLGLLIDPSKKTVYVYRPNQTTQVLKNPATVTCDPELPGFILETSVLFTNEE